MRTLARHLAAPRRSSGASRLVLFDIDGTILDMRALAAHRLAAFDRARGSAWFAGIGLEEATTDGAPLAALCARRGVPPAVVLDLRAFLRTQAIEADSALAGHRPFRGVLDVIRWLTLQPGVEVALNSSRVESRRTETLEALNALGKEYRVSFATERLAMRADDGVDPYAAKVAGLRRFRDAGFEIAAVIDDDPNAIAAMRTACGSEPVLYLLASQLLNARRRVGPGVVQGSSWDVTRLAPDFDLPRHVRLVWDGVDRDDAIDEFLRRPIHVAACTVRVDPCGRLVARREAYEDVAWHPGEPTVSLEHVATRVIGGQRGLRVRLAVDPEELPRVFDALQPYADVADALWLSAPLERLRERGFRRLAERFPRATIECAVDFVEPLAAAFPEAALEALDRLRAAGINCFSVSWAKARQRGLAARMLDWGLAVNVDDVRNFEDYLQAALLTPRSVTYAFSANNSRTKATSSS
jgi:phosphoglycolate phosphatase-like HAD superfamily hydrolase